MHYRHLIILITAIISCLLLNACGKKDKSSEQTRAFIDNVKTKYSTSKPVHLPLKKIQEATYTMSKLRDPFTRPNFAKAKKVYPNSILREYALDTLQVVGVMVHEDKKWAMIKTPNGKIYKLKAGLRVGTDQALVTKIDQNEVTFVGEIPTDDGAKEKTIVLRVKQPEKE